MRTAQRRAEIRRPPPLPYSGKAGAVFDDNGVLVGRLCSLCGTPVPKPRRTWCSQACVDTWNVATFPAAQRHQLVTFHGVRCEECDGEREPDCYDVEVDHRRPLWSLSPDERLELKWWTPFNLQLLGPRCHAAKTRREAAARAHVRRAEAEGRTVLYRGDPPPADRLFAV